MLRIVDASFEADCPSTGGCTSQDGSETARFAAWQRRVRVQGPLPAPTAANSQHGAATGDDFVRRELRQHLPALRRYALALTGNVTRADDLEHDCAERALSRAHLWRQGSLRAWLFAIMHNLNANHRRYAARRPALAPAHLAPESSWPAEQFERLAARQTLAAVSRLSPDHREVLVLVAVEGMTYAGAADVLGVPVGTVMSRLSRARDHLRRLTGEDRQSRRLRIQAA